MHGSTRPRRAAAIILIALSASMLAACDGSITLPTSLPTISPTVALPTAEATRTPVPLPTRTPSPSRRQG